MRTRMLIAVSLAMSGCSLLAFNDLTFDREPADGAGAIHDGAVLEADAVDAALDDVGNDAGTAVPDASEPDAREPDAAIALADPRARPVFASRFPLSPCAGANPLTLRTWITVTRRMHPEMPSCETFGGPVVGVERLVEAREVVLVGGRSFDPVNCSFYRQRVVGLSPIYVEDGVYTSATEGTATVDYHWSSGPGGQSCFDSFEMTFRDEVAE